MEILDPSPFHEDQQSIRDELGSTGLVLIKRVDPINEFFMEIMGQRYSSVGFYYETAVSGLEQIQLVLIDLHGLGESGNFRFTTITDVLNDSLVVEMVIRRIKDPDPSNQEEYRNLQEQFRSVIAVEISRDPKVSIENRLIQLFQGDNINSTPIEFINRVILRLKAAHTLESDTNLDLASQKLARSHIIDTDLFTTLVPVRLPPRKLIDRQKSRINELESSKDLLQKYIGIFVDKILTNHDIFDIVTRRLNRQHDPKDDLEDHFRADIMNVMIGAGNIIDLISEGVVSGSISNEELSRQIFQYIEDEKRLSSKLGTSFDPPSTVAVQSDDRCFRLTGTESSKGGLSYLEQLSGLQQHVQQAFDKVAQKEAPTFDLNGMAIYVNNLIKMSGAPLPLIGTISSESSYQAIAVLRTDHDRKIPMVLQAGKKIILTTTGYNLDNFDSDQLEEILGVLDLLADGDPRFDHLRADITRRISHYN